MILHKEPDPVGSASSFVQGWFLNKVDHNGGDRVFNQRYWVRDDGWDKTNGPIFLYICGEGICKPRGDDSFDVKMAQQLTARYFILEHRYYGYSQPFGDWSDSNLQYLTSK